MSFQKKKNKEKKWKCLLLEEECLMFNIALAHSHEMNEMSRELIFLSNIWMRCLTVEWNNRRDVSYEWHNARRHVYKREMIESVVKFGF